MKAFISSLALGTLCLALVGCEYNPIVESEKTASEGVSTTDSSDGAEKPAEKSSELVPPKNAPTSEDVVTPEAALEAQKPGPSVLFTLPQDGQTMGSPGSLMGFLVAFNRPIDVEALKVSLSESVVLEGGGKKIPVVGAALLQEWKEQGEDVGDLPVNPKATVIFLLLPNSLANETTYQASVSKVKDLEGNAMASPYSWSFKVESLNGVMINELSPSPKNQESPPEKGNLPLNVEILKNPVLVEKNLQLDPGLIKMFAKFSAGKLSLGKEQTFSPYGGDWGKDFETRCLGNQVMVGWWVKHEGIIDQIIEIRCREINAVANHGMDSKNYAVGAGGQGGTPEWDGASAGFAMNGWSLKTGTIQEGPIKTLAVSQLRSLFIDVSKDGIGKNQMDGSTFGQNKAKNPEDWTEHACPPGYLLTGLKAKAGKPSGYLYALGPICREVVGP